MREVLLVGAGGFIGSVARYLVSMAVSASTATAFPLGTAVVNIVGCLLIGILAGAAESRDWVTEPARLFLITGVLGGFTTFSAFAFETNTLLRQGAAGAAVLNVGGQVMVGLAMVWLGMRLASVALR